MRTRVYLTCLTCGWLGCWPVRSGEPIRAGAAAVDITPPLGVPLAGYYHARAATEVLDPLFAKALVIEAEGAVAAWVSLDLISITRSITDQARAAIQKTLGIPSPQVLLSATHAHTGPELARRSRRSQDQVGQSKLALDYTERLPERIAEAVALAYQQRQPAQLSLARSRCDTVAFNRRYFMRDGSVAWNPGKGNPDIVLPAGPTDPELTLLYVQPRKASDPRQALATYVNFALHPDTTGGSRISADWPGALSRVLAGYHGSNHLTLVANGPCGNLNHLDCAWPWPQNGPGEAHRIAVLLGAAVFQAYKTLVPLVPGPIAARSQPVELALPEITPEQLEEARQIVAQTPNDRGTNFMRLVRAYRVLEVADRQGRPYEVEVQVIALGRQVAWVALPGEVFVELGLAIKQRSPFPYTFVVELANENIGYIPDRRSYAEGQYEPESARCAPGSGEKLVATAVDLLKALFAQAPAQKPGPLR